MAAKVQMLEAKAEADGAEHPGLQTRNAGGPAAGLILFG